MHGAAGMKHAPTQGGQDRAWALHLQIPVSLDAFFMV
jgi:hypothetical protein